MDDIEIEFLHLCENAFLSKNSGGLNVIQAFNELEIDVPSDPEEAPEGYGPVEFFSVIGISGKPSNHQLKISFFDPDGNLVGSSMTTPINISDGKSHSLMITRYPNISFKKDGDHKIEFDIDNGKKIRTIKLGVHFKK